MKKRGTNQIGTDMFKRWCLGRLLGWFKACTQPSGIVNLWRSAFSVLVFDLMSALSRWYWTTRTGHYRGLIGGWFGSCFEGQVLAREETFSRRCWAVSVFSSTPWGESPFLIQRRIWSLGRFPTRHTLQKGHSWLEFKKMWGTNFSAYLIYLV